MPKPFKESSSIKWKINFDKRLFQEVEKKNFSQSRVEKKRLQPTFGIITSDVHRNLLNKIAYDENIIKMRIGYLQSYKLLEETQRIKCTSGSTSKKWDHLFKKLKIRNEKIAEIISDYETRYFQKSAGEEYGISHKNVNLRRRKMKTKPPAIWNEYIYRDKVVQHYFIIFNPNWFGTDKSEIAEQNCT